MNDTNEGRLLSVKTHWRDLIAPFVPRYDAYPKAKAGWLDRMNLPMDPLRADGRFSRL